MAFITSAETNAVSGDIDYYNTFVTNIANTVPQLAQLGTTWTIIGSTAAMDARVNTSTNPSSSVGVPIFRLDGVLVASSNADLWDGSLSARIYTIETGDPTNLLVWTGTTAGGTNAGLFALGGDFDGSIMGLASYGVGDDWVNYDSDSKAFLKSVYAISGVLTVVPEPTPRVLATIGLIGLAAWRRKNFFPTH